MQKIGSSLGNVKKETELDWRSKGLTNMDCKAISYLIAMGALDHLTVCWRPTALSPCLETPHVHSPDSEHLFDVPYTGA